MLVQDKKKHLNQQRKQFLVFFYYENIINIVTNF